MKSQGITISRIHPLRTMVICAKFHGHSSNSCCDISPIKTSVNPMVVLEGKSVFILLQNSWIPYNKRGKQDRGLYMQISFIFSHMYALKQPKQLELFHLWCVFIQNSLHINVIQSHPVHTMGTRTCFSVKTLPHWWTRALSSQESAFSHKEPINNSSNWLTVGKWSFYESRERC